MSHPVDLHVGKRFRHLRKRTRLTQQSVAKALGLTFQQVQRYERGINRVSASKLYEAAILFGVPVADFFEGLTSFDSRTEDARATDRLAINQELVQLFERLPETARPHVLALIQSAAKAHAREARSKPRGLAHSP